MFVLLHKNNACVYACLLGMTVLQVNAALVAALAAASCSTAFALPSPRPTVEFGRLV